MRRTAAWLRGGLLWAGALMMAYPFLWMVGTGFETLNEAVQPSINPWPASWQWNNYAAPFTDAPFLRYFFNSLLTGIAVTAATVFTALCAGYAFARLPFRGRGPLFVLVLATLMVPFELALIPNFVTISQLGWYDRYAALVVPWCANAFAIFLVRQAFLSLPRDYFDAAALDGCGHFRFLFTIGAPLVRPSLITVALFAFLGSYNALLWPLIVTASEDMRVVQVGLMAYRGDAGVQVHQLMAASAVVIAPGVLLYFVAQRHLIAGALGAGIKE